MKNIWIFVFSSSKKLLLIFIKILLAIVFGGGDFLVTLKPESERALVPLRTFSFPSGEKIFWGKSSLSYKRYSNSAQSMVCAESIVQISFATKNTLRIKIQCWLLIWCTYMNASPFGMLKIWQFCCFWLISFSLQKELSAFWVFCWPRYSWANLQSFGRPALHSVRSLYSFGRFSFFAKQNIFPLFARVSADIFCLFHSKLSQVCWENFASKHYFTQNLYCTIQNIWKFAMLG